MSDKGGRDPVVDASPFEIVPATEDEGPDFWLLRDDTDPFPIHLAELHTLMGAIDALHGAAHHH